MAFADNIILRTFVTAYNSSLKVQDQISQNRLRFAQRLYEMSEELQTLAREGEKARKTVSHMFFFGQSDALRTLYSTKKPEFAISSLYKMPNPLSRNQNLG